ncbi:hypothetical protein HanXRQr2_Chr15g0670991 [Helianthus annuus]|uniref:Uncharacterized protein n=1 Tax=Helianthus annuus TaxID=4232 RepID=A0A9K3DYG0_HELAN|nr:hypothetical protein HanXRQr2_Chr15g0670991 [Helianthus annuus]KAJ0829444.1 hypothetical protein HanPSC8_Chr15g0644041 [Helianthus annuus]
MSSSQIVLTAATQFNSIIALHKPQMTDSAIFTTLAIDFRIIASAGGVEATTLFFFFFGKAIAAF